MRLGAGFARGPALRPTSSPLFEPIALGPLRAKNRLAMTPHSGAGKDLRYFEDRARGGCGLVIYNAAATGVFNYSPAPGRPVRYAQDEMDAVLPNPASPEGVAFYDERFIPHLRGVADMFHAHGVILVSQLAHLGAAPTVPRLVPSIGPSAIRNEEAHSVPVALEEEHIADLVAAYGYAARRAREGGADAVELHAAHGYLLEQFLSPYTNRRTDRYGGSFENRLRIIREILVSIDRLGGADFPVGLRIVGDEFTERGLSATDVAAIVSALQDRLIYVNVSGGTTTGLLDGLSLPYATPWLVPPGYNAPAAATIRKAVSIPVMLTGKVLDPAQAERLLTDGDADMIGMARAWLADPDWGVKAQAGHEVRPCIGTLECHAERRSLRCTVNPDVGREDELAILPAPTRRRVLVAGGGPAGLYAARTAAIRGHQVVLCEMTESLGGQARVMALDPTHSKLRDWLGYLEREARRVAIDLRLGVEVTSDLVVRERPDVVIVATGATPALPEVPGILGGNVVTAPAVLEGRATVGKSALVIAGLDDHLGPLSIADVLASRGHSVTLVSESLHVGMAVEPRTIQQLLKRLLDKNVRLMPLTEVIAVENGAVLTRNVLTRADGLISGVETVVVSIGAVADDRLARALRSFPAEVHRVGDALAPRRIIHAVLDGARIGVAI